MDFAGDHAIAVRTSHRDTKTITMTPAVSTAKGSAICKRPRCSRDGRAHVLKSSLISVLRDSLWGRCYRSSGRLGAQRNAICPSDLADLVATGASHQIGCSHGGQGAILSFRRRSLSLSLSRRSSANGHERSGVAMDRAGRCGRRWARDDDDGQGVRRWGARVVADVMECQRTWYAATIRTAGPAGG